MRRTLVRLVVPILLATASLVAIPASPASAAEGECAGGIIWRGDVNISGERVGELVVYFNAANGNNCARFNRLGSARGTATHTWVEIQKCRETTRRGVCTLTSWETGYDFESGPFKYYAGPVSVHAPNNCVSAKGGLRWNGVEKSVLTPVNIGC
jgi:hypothetical protein